MPFYVSLDKFSTYRNVLIVSSVVTSIGSDDCLPIDLSLYGALHFCLNVDYEFWITLNR